MSSAGIPSNSRTSISTSQRIVVSVAPKPLVARREEQVLDRRVDRGPTRDGWAVELGIGEDEAGEHGAHDDEYRDLVEVVGEMVGVANHVRDAP